MPDADDDDASGSESVEELPSDAKVVGQPRLPNRSKFFEDEALRKKVARWKDDPPKKSYWTDRGRCATQLALRSDNAV